MGTFSITERGQRINRTTDHFENYLLVFQDFLHTLLFYKLKVFIKHFELLIVFKLKSRKLKKPYESALTEHQVSFLGGKPSILVEEMEH